MKKTILISVALIATVLSVNVFAQNKPSQPSDKDFAKFKAERLKTELGLNETQYNKVYNYFKECEANKPAKELKDSCKGKECSHSKGDKTRPDYKSKNQEFMKSVLTPEQYTKWLENSNKDGKKGCHKSGDGQKPKPRPSSN